MYLFSKKLLLGLGLVGPWFLFPAATAQVDWAMRTPTQRPSVRLYPVMTYDSQRGETVMFSGYDIANLGDTWVWDGTNWTEKIPATSPAPRRRPAMTFDSGRGVAVLYGGYSGWGNYAETWEWNGVTWLLRNTVNYPGRRDAHTMAYDAARHKVVLFAGSIGVTVNDTWEYDGVDWTLMSPATSPPARVSHGMAYDVSRGKVVVFGGWNPGGTLLSDTWEWDGVNWLQTTPLVSPPARGAAGMVYDHAKKRVVLFGGYSAASTYLSDTWEYDGVQWMQRSPATSPPGRAWFDMVFDIQRCETVLFGGTDASTLYNDTWVYAPTNMALARSFGLGCPIGAQPPELAAELPWIGGTLDVRLGSLLTSDIPFLIFGNSTTTWGDLGLPYDLSVIGMTNCTLYTNPAEVLSGTNTAGIATWRMPIANLARWIGVSIYIQGIVGRTGANPLGIVASNAVELKFGAR